MLRLHIITVGRDKQRWVTDQIDHYRKLIRKYAALELTTVPESRYTKSADISDAMESEAAAIRSRLKNGYAIALDAGGRQFDTESFADTIARLQVDRHSLIEFIIGGPHGLHSSLKHPHPGAGAPHMVMSLSPLTVSHQVARLVLLEQLYRVLNLNAGGSYHK